MTPNFALSLSFEGIRLLHRVTEGWHLVGEVAIDDPQLSDKMANLRQTALAIDPQGLRCKLLLPNEQIKYLAIDTPRATDEEIVDMLVGATPYAIDELTYDYTRGGGRTYVAAVAKETLSEAEQFARDFKFNPVCFAAVPDAFTFVGEPFFGLTDSAKALVGAGETLERDADPVLVTGTVDVSGLDIAAPTAEVTPEPAPEPAPEPVPEVAPIAEPTAEPETEVITDAETEAEPEAESPADTAAEPAQQAAPEPDATPQAPAAEETSAAEPEETPAPATVPVFTSAARSATGAAPVLMAAAPKTTLETPRLDLPRDPEPAAPAIVRTPAPAAPSVADGKPEPEAKSTGLFRTRRRKTLRDQAPKPEEPSTESERMTVFGARRQTKGWRPKYLGLILTAILLFFLAAVALWAAVTDQTIAQVLRLAPAEQSQIVTTEPLLDGTEPLPSNFDEIADDFADLEGLDGIETPIDDQVAALTEDTTDAGAEVAAAAPAAPTVLTPAEAQARYEQTGVWQRAPSFPFLPRAETADDIRIAAIDPVTHSADAVALPAARAMLPDLPFVTPLLPLPAGSALALDDRGFVAATPEGTVTPYGTVVFLGAPDVVPPLRPQADDIDQAQTAEAPADDAQAAPETLSPELAAIAAFRPQLRPEDTLEQIERQSLGGFTLSELAAFRPRIRPDDLIPPEINPADVAAIAQAVTEANEGVMTASLRPELRPANVPQPAATQASAASTAGVVTSAPATTRPSGPIPGGVAANATEESVLPLRQMSLLGVAGTSSSRRALIRLRNGDVITVRVGDSLDGGQVTAITSTSVNYVKRGTTYGIEMPRG